MGIAYVLVHGRYGVPGIWSQLIVTNRELFDDIPILITFFSVFFPPTWGAPVLMGIKRCNV